MTPDEIKIDWWNTLKRRITRLQELVELRAPAHIVRKELALVARGIDKLYPEEAPDDAP